MYEVQGCGVTLEFTKHHATAFGVYENSVSPEVTLYKYDSAGNKRIVAQRYRSFSVVHSKQKQ